jgi:hypothetical protein
MWVETYGGRRYDYEGEEVPEHASTLVFELAREHFGHGSEGGAT